MHQNVPGGSNLQKPKLPSHSVCPALDLHGYVEIKVLGECI